MVRLLFSFLILLGSVLPLLAEGPWIEDFEAAKKASAASGKPILVDITGSDWCPPCQRMEAEVFSRPDFLKDAPAKYVLLRLDYPRKIVQSEKLRVQNQKLAEKYPFEGYPTYMLLDSQGLLYGQYTGYLAGGTKAFFQMVEGMDGQKKVLTALSDTLKKSAAGVDRAKAQDALFRQAEAWGLSAQYGDLPLKIVQEDKDNKAGLKARYLVFNAYLRLLSTWTEGSDFQKAVTDLDKLSAQAQSWPDLKQRIVFTRGMVWWNALNDEQKAKASLQEARALGPETPTGLRSAELLDQLP